MQERANDTVQTVRDHATALAKEIVDIAAARAISGTERAREVGSSLASSASARARDIPHRVNEDVVPSLRDIALNAASAALDLWQVAREKASEAGEFAQHEAGEAIQLVGAAERRAKDVTREVAERLEHASERAKEVSAHAAEATVKTSKDTGATLLWGAAAAAVIFYVVLNQERREQVLKLVDSVVKQTKELIKDFQGYDEEFA